MPWSATVPPVIVPSWTRHPNAAVIVTLPPPVVFAAMKQMLDEPVSMARLLVPSARPPATQLVASVTSLPPVQVPAAYAVGKPDVAATPRAIGLSIACWKILESVQAMVSPPGSASRIQVRILREARTRPRYRRPGPRSRRRPGSRCGFPGRDARQPPARCRGSRPGPAPGPHPARSPEPPPGQPGVDGQVVMIGVGGADRHVRPAVVPVPLDLPGQVILALLGLHLAGRPGADQRRDQHVQAGAGVEPGRARREGSRDLGQVAVGAFPALAGIEQRCRHRRGLPGGQVLPGSPARSSAPGCLGYSSQVTLRRAIVPCVSRTGGLGSPA